MVNVSFAGKGSLAQLLLGGVPAQQGPRGVGRAGRHGPPRLAVLRRMHADRVDGRLGVPAHRPLPLQPEQPHAARLVLRQRRRRPPLRDAGRGFRPRGRRRDGLRARI